MEARAALRKVGWGTLGGCARPGWLGLSALRAETDPLMKDAVETRAALRKVSW